ncbi:MAG: DUF3482 domain-containing protein, partial [Comamonadaceae bacterium]
LPVLNFVRDAASREPAWRELLSAYGLHAVVRFDAAAPFVGAERELYQDLGALLRDRREALSRVVDALAAEAQDRRRAAASRIAELVIDAAALRRSVPADAFNDATRRQGAISALEQDVSAKAQRAASDLLALYGFREGDADEAPLPLVEGRWSMDFFSPEAMKDAGLRLGKGAAVGAAVGVVADLALAGLSLGAATALGASIGGAVSQGWGPVGRKLANMLRDVQELTVEDHVLYVLVAWQLALVQALAQRGHAATQRIASDTAANDTTSRDVAAVVRAARAARGHPSWESDWKSGLRSRWSASGERQAAVNAVAEAVRAALERNDPARPAA